MRQIAALPYRPTSSACEPALEVLLITSRRTGRWVVPKGNPMKGLSRPAAAAQEAIEEAGVTGAISARSLGRYRVLKLMRSGELRWLDVDLFPLAVTAELPSWPEETQRTRRWFALSAAAAAVDEPDLRELILAFRPLDLDVARRGDLPAQTTAALNGRKSPKSSRV